MMEFLSEAHDRFRHKVKLLIIDDDASICTMLGEIFVSPLFCISSVTSLEEAYRIIGNSPDQWHCWIVDVDLGCNRTGLDLLRRYPQFSFSVILSGLHSMTTAAEAMGLGARTVVDKSHEYIDKLYDEVCKTAALGFVLRGCPTPHLQLFLLLQKAATASVEEWAKTGCMEVRRLQRICELYSLSPRYALSLYRTIYYLLWQIPGDQTGEEFRTGFGPLDEQRKLYETSIEYIVKRAKSQGELCMDDSEPVLCRRKMC
jgi:hypothetical protein